jgi:hypothetical protein
VRILAVQCAHYQSKFGNLSMPEEEPRHCSSPGGRRGQESGFEHLAWQRFAE